MAAIEFRDPKSRITGIDSKGAKLDSLCSALHTLVQKECMNRGLLVLTTSIFPVLRLIPALIVSEEEVDKALQVIADSIATVAHSLSM
jgi:4-aminobutyrate aminotransferase